MGKLINNSLSLYVSLAFSFVKLAKLEFLNSFLLSLKFILTIMI